MNSELERLKAKGLSEIHDYYDAERAKMDAYYAEQLKRHRVDLPGPHHWWQSKTKKG